MDQDGIWHGGGPRSRPHCARWGPIYPPQKRRQSLPIFGPFLLWPNGWMHQQPLCMKVGLSPGDFVLDGDPVPLPQKGAGAPQFSAHIYCCLTAGWIKMPLGTEVGLGPGDSVRPSFPHPEERAQPPIFGPCLLWPNGCMYQDTIWYEGRPQSRRHCVRWGPSSPLLTGFRPMFVAAKRLDGLRCHLAWR